jgi:hypothetical protein
MNQLLIPVLLALASALQAAPSWWWVEGETPAQSQVTRHPWYGAVKRELCSGGDLLSHWSAAQAGEASYQLALPEGGDCDFWIRANPVQAKLSYSLNGGPFTALDFSRGQTGSTNIAADGKPDLRFLCWCNPGTVKLRAGRNEVRFRFESDNNHHGMLDCFVVSRQPFQPSGTLKPDEIQQHLDDLKRQNQGWTPWLPARDEFRPSPVDLRPLNEKLAGVQGRVRVADGRFLLGNGQPVRFWAVNGPPESVRGEDLKRCARMLAKRGVNLVRIHGAVFDGKTGAFRPPALARIREVVAAMKNEGIYTHLSIYFPLWFTPEPGLPVLAGYDGKSHPFAAIYFNPEFQQMYWDWWTTLLASPGPDGKPLLDEPALLGVELVNEDSFFFWTFNDKNLPPPQLEILETRFAGWAGKKHGSLEAASRAWNGLRLPRDTGERLGFRPLYQIFTDRTPRDRDTAAFLFESQRAFYQESAARLRKLGFQGLITASNWITANDDILGPLERASYTAGDFIDRHGYFGGLHEGDNAAWSIREGHVFTHRSALGFEPASPGQAREFSHPVFDLKINGLPSMISETTFTRPNRFRTEGPLLYAAYGALQGSDSIVHFALDSADWSVKPGFFMQPWTLMSPAMIGQFPAAALIFRRGLLDEGEMMARVSLSLADAKALKGSPLSQQASLDVLREADVDKDARAGKSRGIDPRVHLVGRTRLDLTEKAARAEIRDLAPFVDDKAQTITSSTRQLVWDFGRRLLRIDSPQAQGMVGNLAAAAASLPQVAISSDLDLGAIVVVSLDGKPLAVSGRMLLQVMTEERPSDFAAEPLDRGRFRITSPGTDPWLIREPRGMVRLNRPDAARLKVTPLDANGCPRAVVGDASRIELEPDTVYYLIAP